MFVLRVSPWRSAQGRCLSKHRMRFLCTHVVGKAETCAERMPLKAQDKGRMRTCQDMKNNNWRKTDSSLPLRMTGRDSE